MSRRQKPSGRTLGTPEIARELGIGDRRLQQLIAEQVLPPLQEGLHGLDDLRKLYRLYRHGTHEEWLIFLHDVLAEARQAERLIEAACEPASRPDQVRNASIALQRVMAALRCFVATKVPEGLRDLQLDHVRRLEDEALVALLAQLPRFTPDQIKACLDPRRPTVRGNS
ncbi:hypothetical protein [Methylobacterium isbiliense]|uniref:Uncharacterized protein n=1 Tax=Methylobacterium isbiliense TaxID=315478 RepID=A0ABQ4SDN3_9HYPH|nr:hypothetical protein [Methylobacterium isbiliense]MDN3625587.1 hypothetical protein [Methylobacterium isbiliense]GJE00023.1 hypothetical protein GMJLKIPL_1941 [Methylobacterium isbiliense]